MNNYGGIIRFFTCGISGDECAVILFNGEEKCVSADEAWDLEAKSQARHDELMLRWEQGC